MSWIHEPFKHKKRGLYKRKNWLFQVKGKFYLKGPRGVRIIRDGASAWFGDYRDRGKSKVWAPPSSEREKGKWINPRKMALDFAKSGRFYDYRLIAVDWSVVRWREVSEKTFKKWQKEQKKKRELKRKRRKA